MAEILSGGLNWGSTQQAIVTMDKEGHPLTCCNPVTGECLGGGGSSDFSTAEVTITSAGNGLLIAFIDSNAVLSGIFEAATINAILYKGVAIVTEFDEGDLTINSGSAEYLLPDSHRIVKITGDCSIGVADT